MYGVQLSPELGSLRGVVPKLSLEMGNLLLSYCQLAAQAGLAPLKALHTLPTTQTVFFQTPANHQAELRNDLDHACCQHANFMKGT